MPETKAAKAHWIAASKSRFLLAMTRKNVIAKVRSTCGDPLARNESGQSTRGLPRQLSKASPHNPFEAMKAFLFKKKRLLEIVVILLIILFLFFCIEFI
ncbi:MAG: hypothetical protein V6Z78_03750 [Holosporaceae bacterium]